MEIIGKNLRMIVISTVLKKSLALIYLLLPRLAKNIKI